MKRFIIAAAMTAALCSTVILHAADKPSAAVKAAVDNPARPAADKERDANRKPLEVVAFAGVKPGMTVAELSPGGGYYTRILAKTVGPQGKVYALITPGSAQRAGVLDNLNKLVTEYGNVEIVTADYTAIALPTKADLFWTTENYHDFHNGPTANINAINKSVFDNLKPGGIYFVEDHNAADGAGLEATSKVHRMDLAIAKSELSTAGFKLDAEGTALKNPADNRAGANGESGKFMSDRFMLRLKRP
ncbi:MAG: methyltransferase [Steroidobacteraceae bacterium]